MKRENLLSDKRNLNDKLLFTYGNSARDSQPPSDSANVNIFKAFKNLLESPFR